MDYSYVTITITVELHLSWSVWSFG